MSGRAWTPAEDARLRQLYPITRTSELPALLGRSRMAIKVRAANMHLRKDPAASMRREWDANEDAVLRMAYPDTPTDAVAALLERTLTTVYQRAQRLGLAKSAEYLASPASGRTSGRQGMGTRFQKGHVTHNKGKAFPTAALHPNCRKTHFKKGVRQGVAVKLWKPIGTERVSKDGYLERKINNDWPLQMRWRAVHLLTWEAANGPLPKGHKVVFKNGDKRDIRLDNLELLSNAEVMRRNTIHNLPPDLARTIQLVGALNRKINRRTKREEQDRRSA